MFIDKWWEISCGATDDALLLIEYFEEKDKRNFTFTEIMKDLHLDNVLGKKPIYESGVEEGYYWKKGRDDNIRCNFDIVTDVIIDLSALLLQCLVDGCAAFDSLSSEPKKQIVFSISADAKEIQLLSDELEKAVDNPILYYPDFLQDEFLECTAGIREISNELKKFI